MIKVILFYKFTPVPDCQLTRLWQMELCRRLGLTGRVIIAEHGINGTLAGPVEDLKAYKKALNQTDFLKGIVYKWSNGSEGVFPKLSVKVRNELVTLDSPEEFDVYDSGIGLKPEAWRQYLQDNPEAIVLDARNQYESEIGYFKAKNLIKPRIKTFKDIKQVVAKLPKDQPVLTYCTGDIRCEYLSAYMKHKKFKQVYHLDGGIMKYGETFPRDDLWQGHCYVFDKRMKLAFSGRASEIGRCVFCQGRTAQQANCDDCNRQLVVCPDCSDQKLSHCQDEKVRGR